MSQWLEASTCSHRILTEPEQSSSHPSDPSSFHFIHHISNSHSLWGMAICMLELLRKAIKQPPFTSRLPLIKPRVWEAPVVGGGNTAMSLKRWKYDGGSSGVISMLTSWKRSRRGGAWLLLWARTLHRRILRQRFGDICVPSSSDSVFVISAKTSCFSAESLIIQSFSSLQAPNSDRLEISPWQHCYFIALKRLICKMLLHFGPFSLLFPFFPPRLNKSEPSLVDVTIVLCGKNMFRVFRFWKIPGRLCKNKILVAVSFFSAGYKERLESPSGPWKKPIMHL